MAAFLELAKQTLAPFFTAGGSRTIVRWLAVIMALDYLTAVLSALLGRAKHGKTLSSRIGFIGIVRKSLAFVIVGVAYLVDEALGVTAFCPITIKGLIINEAISTLQNVSLVGTWIPPALKNGLTKLAGETGKKTDGD